MINTRPVDDPSHARSALWVASCVFATTALTALAVAYPSWFFMVLTFGFIAILVYMDLMIGAYLLTLFYPLTSSYINVNFQWSTPFSVFAVQILNLLLFMVLTANYLSHYHRSGNLSSFKKIHCLSWILYFVCAFLVWSCFVVSWSDHQESASLGLLRFSTSFITMIFLMAAVDSYEKFIRLLTFYCCVAALFAVGAILATYAAFLQKHILLSGPKASATAQVALFNQPGGFAAPIVGMISGFGFCGKHELSMLLLAGIFFALFLMKEYESMLMRSILVFFIILYATIIHQAFVKLTILGSLLIVVFFCVSVPSWRKNTLSILLVFFAINAVAFQFSNIIRPAHMKATESSAAKVEKAVAQSKYQAGSLSERLLIWQKTMERVVHGSGMGNGPDSLERDLTFGHHHGHNFLLTFASEYGVPALGFIVAVFFIIGAETYRSIFAGSHRTDKLWWLQLALTATVLAALIEYTFDCFVWWQQLWYGLGLLLASLKLNFVDVEKNCKMSAEKLRSA